MSKPLDDLATVTKRREALKTRHRALIVSARAEGHTLRAIATAAGLTSAGVLHILRRQQTNA